MQKMLFIGRGTQNLYLAAAVCAFWPQPAAAQAAKQPAAAESKTVNNHAETGFNCTAVANIGAIGMTVYGVQIGEVRARAIPGIAGGFNLFELSYKVINGNAQKIWVSGEFVFGAAGSLTGALSASSGLTGILPNESEVIKSTVLANNVFFQTQNLCFRFNVEQQKQ